MIECIFTVDYEIYGNGDGSLRELVYEPAERLMSIFRKRNARFVPFVEVAELEMMATNGKDPAIVLVEEQLRSFRRDGFELGLHLHPQWYKGRYEDGRWHLDYSEYNLCTLPRERIAQIVDRAIAYLREVLGEADFSPVSFRAGNWLLQPARTVATVMSDRGIKIDSSVFKGGLRHEHGLDYRRAQRNGYFWRFNGDVSTPDPKGALIEVPIYTQMVPFWRLFNAKRIHLEKKSSAGQTVSQRINRLLDLLRVRHPLKLDYCRMTMSELTGMMDKIIQEDRLDPSSYRPVVAIGHTKELVDIETVDAFLAYLGRKGIAVSTFDKVYQKCSC